MLQLDYTTIGNGITRAQVQNMKRIINNTEIYEDPREEEYIKIFDGIITTRRNAKGFIFVWDNDENENIEDENENIEDLQLFGTLTSLLTSLIPYIKEELSKRKSKKSIYDIFPELAYKQDKDGKYILLAKDPDTKAGEIIASALDAQKLVSKQERAKKAREIQQQDIQEQPNSIVSKIHYNPTNEVNLTTGMLAKSFYCLTPEFKTTTSGKLILEVTYITKKNKKVVVTASAIINREYLEENGIDNLTFDPGYDNMVRITSDNLYATGNSCVSITKFLHEMGQSYSQKEASKLIEALKKGSATPIKVNNKDLLEAYGYNTKTYKVIDRRLIPVSFSEDRYKVNGNLANLEINIENFSPFYDVDNPINQITTYDKLVFTLYRGRRTTRYYRVLMYLLNDIAWLRKGDRNNKFLFSTIYKFVGDTTPHQREATQEVVFDLLDQVFLVLDYISSYTPARPKKGEKLADYFEVTYNKKRIPFRNHKEQKQLKAKNQK